MSHSKSKSIVKRGMGTVETVLLILLVACGLLIIIQKVGFHSKEQLNSTANELETEGSFFGRFTGQKQKAEKSKAAEETEAEYESEYERQKGNNGVGNGLDPQPPGDPPINDGPGTSPGNPGNRGGF